MDWLDSGIGGFPASGVVAAVGDAGAGKTSLALAFALSALQRGPTCYLTSESPEAVLETGRTMLERDLAPHVKSGRLTLLAFVPFFVNKVRSLNSVEAPLEELGEFFAERQIQHVIFDTFDPLLTWIDAANATASARNILAQIQSWGISVLCTMSGGAAPAISEFARIASGSIQLAKGKITVHHAGWCNVYHVDAPIKFVQGRGLAVGSPAGASKPPPAAVPRAESSRPAGGQPQMWKSLIVDRNQILGTPAPAIIRAPNDVPGALPANREAAARPPSRMPPKPEFSPPSDRTNVMISIPVDDDEEPATLSPDTSRTIIMPSGGGKQRR